MISKRFLHYSTCTIKPKFLNTNSIFYRTNYLVSQLLTWFFIFFFSIVLLNLGFFYLNYIISYFSGNEPKILLEILKQNPILLTIIPWFLSYKKSLRLNFFKSLAKPYLQNLFAFLYLKILSRINNPKILLIINLIDKVWFFLNLIYSYYIKFKKTLFIITLVCNFFMLFYGYITNELSLNEISEFFLFVIASYNIYTLVFKGVSIRNSPFLTVLFLFCNVMILIFCWHSFISVILHIITFIKKLSSNNHASQTGSSKPGPSGPNKPNEPSNISPGPQKRKWNKINTSNMTEEEIKKLKEKREKDAIYQRNRRNNMSEEKRQEVRIKNCESERRRREARTLEQIEIDNAKKRKRREEDNEIKNFVILQEQKRGFWYQIHYGKKELDVLVADEIVRRLELIRKMNNK